MYCPECGHLNTDEDQFCEECGCPLKEDVQPNEENLVTEHLSFENNQKLQPSSSSYQTKNLIIALVSVVAIVGIAVGGYFFYQHQQSQQDLQQQKKELIEAKKEADEAKEDADKAKEDAKKATEEKKEAEEKVQDVIQNNKNSKKVFSNYTFEPGWYTANYNMKIRMQPSYNAPETDKLSKGENVFITDIANGDNNSTWGLTNSGGWICIMDSDYQYLLVG